MNAQKEPDHKTDFSRVPDSVLGALIRETAKMDCEMHVGTPEGVELSDRHDRWELFAEADLETTEWVDDGGLCAYYSNTYDHQYQKYAATRTDPAAYETVELNVEISVSWSMDTADKPVVHIEVYE